MRPPPPSTRRWSRAADIGATVCGVDIRLELLLWRGWGLGRGTLSGGLRQQTALRRRTLPTAWSTNTGSEGSSGTGSHCCAHMRSACIRKIRTSVREQRGLRTLGSCTGCHVIKGRQKNKLDPESDRRRLVSDASRFERESRCYRQM